MYYICNAIKLMFMKKYILACLFVATCLAQSLSFAQDFTVRVQSDRQQPIAYAHISINGGTFGVTDEYGVMGMQTAIAEKIVVLRTK